MMQNNNFVIIININTEVLTFKIKAFIAPQINKQAENKSKTQPNIKCSLIQPLSGRAEIGAFTEKAHLAK